MPEMQLKRRKAMNRVNIKKGKVGRNAAGGYEKISALVGYFGAVGSGDDTGRGEIRIADFYERHDGIRYQ